MTSYVCVQTELSLGKYSCDTELLHHFFCLLHAQYFALNIINSTLELPFCAEASFPLLLFLLGCDERKESRQFYEKIFVRERETGDVAAAKYLRQEKSKVRKIKVNKKYIFA